MGVQVGGYAFAARLFAGDGVAIESEQALRIVAANEAEFLVFDLP